MQTIKALKKAFFDANSQVGDAERRLVEKRAARKEAANALAVALAEAEGIRAGQIVEHEYGRGKARGRIVKVEETRWGRAAGDGFRVIVQAIKKDGTDGARTTDVESIYFKDRTDWNGQVVPATAKVVEG